MGFTRHIAAVLVYLFSAAYAVPDPCDWQYSSSFPVPLSSNDLEGICLIFDDHVDMSSLTLSNSHVQINPGVTMKVETLVLDDQSVVDVHGSLYVQEDL